MSRVVHFEFATPDPAREAGFFEAAFGWKISRWGEEEYWLADTGEGMGINGAIMRLSAPDQPRVVNTLGVEDLDASIESAIAAGATLVMGRQEVPGVGWTATMLSPTGILFGLIEPIPGSMGM